MTWAKTVQAGLCEAGADEDNEEENDTPGDLQEANSMVKECTAALELVYGKEELQSLLSQLTQEKGETKEVEELLDQQILRTTYIASQQLADAACSFTFFVSLQNCSFFTNHSCNQH